MSYRSETWTDGKLVELVVNNLDGTGTRTTYAPDGSVTATEALTGLPIPPPPTPTPEERIAQLEAVIRSLGIEV